MDGSSVISIESRRQGDPLNPVSHFTIGRSEETPIANRLLRHGNNVRSLTNTWYRIYGIAGEPWGNSVIRPWGWGQIQGGGVLGGHECASRVQTKGRGRMDGKVLNAIMWGCKYDFRAIPRWKWHKRVTLHAQCLPTDLGRPSLIVRTLSSCDSRYMRGALLGRVIFCIRAIRPNRN